MNEQLEEMHQQGQRIISNTADFARSGASNVHGFLQTGVGKAQDTLTGVKHEAAGILHGPVSQAQRLVSESRSPEAKANQKYAESFDQAIEEAKAEEKRRAAAPTGGKKRRRGGTKKKGGKHKKKTQKKHHKKKHHKKKHHKKKRGRTIKKGAGHKRVGGTKKKGGRKGKGKK